MILGIDHFLTCTSIDLLSYSLFGQTRLIEVGWQGVRGDITDVPADYAWEVVLPGWHGGSVVYEGGTVCCRVLLKRVSV